MSTQVVLTANDWKLIASGVKTARTRVTLTNPNGYMYDVVPAGGPAPNPTLESASRFPEVEKDFQYRDPVDIWMYSKDNDGRIEYDSDGPFQDVFLQDQISPILDWLLTENLGAVTLASDVVINSFNIDLVPGHGVIVGDFIEFFEGFYFLQSRVTNVIGDQISLEMPMDQPFTTAAECRRANASMDVDGSISNVTFDFCPGGTAKYDITRTILVMTHSGAGDDSLFGNLPALTEGVYFRKHNGINKNLFNVKTNGGFRLRAYDLTYSDKAGPGLHSTSVRRSFAGQDKNGVVVRVDSLETDAVEAVVRDNLTGLTDFAIVIQGHMVD